MPWLLPGELGCRERAHAQPEATETAETAAAAAAAPAPPEEAQVIVIDPVPAPAEEAPDWGAEEDEDEAQDMKRDVEPVVPTLVEQTTLSSIKPCTMIESMCVVSRATFVACSEIMTSLYHRPTCCVCAWPQGSLRGERRGGRRR